MQAVTAPIPVTLLTGFLGSGKTTLLNALVRQPLLARALVIINEFGSVGLDHLLVARGDESAAVVAELPGGCLCCTLRADLARTLRELPWRFAREGRRLFDRVVIETTGLADPAPILHTLIKDAQLASQYRLDGIVTTVDGVLAGHTLACQPEARKQVAVADRLVLTKTDLASPDTLATLHAALATLNPAAQRIEAAHGCVDAGVLMNAGLFDAQGRPSRVLDWLGAQAYAPPRYRRAGAAADPDRHDAHIRAFCHVSEQPLERARVLDWLDAVMRSHGAGLLRLKALVNIAGRDGPTVLHAVQHVLHAPLELPAWPSPERRSRFVCIARDPDEAALAASFARLDA